MPLARILRIAIIAAGASAALVRWPPALVERWFARGLYPRLQTTLTSWSNESPLALFDFLLAVAVIVAVTVLVRGVRDAARRRSLRPLASTVTTLAALAAGGYLWFLAAWGLNYARIPIDEQLGFDGSRVTSSGVRALAGRALAEVNGHHAAAHASGFPEAYEIHAPLVGAMHEIGRRLGRDVPLTPSRPKRTMLGVFFRAAGVDGMHAPFLLETLLNPDLTPPERGAVLAHEWAHLAGFAPEADASFVGLLAALRADPASRYSAWFALLHESVALLPRGEQQALLEQLEAGPRADREAMLDRHERRVEAVSQASWQTYDRYLRTQGVEEGVQSYSRVVQLLLATGALDWP